MLFRSQMKLRIESTREAKRNGFMTAKMIGRHDLPEARSIPLRGAGEQAGDVASVGVREVHERTGRAVARDFEALVNADDGRERVGLDLPAIALGAEDHDEEAAVMDLADEGLVSRAGDAELREEIFAELARHGLRGVEGVRREAGEIGRAHV